MIPVLIITLCRYEHLLRCIESLQKNEYAKETDLYIGVDYPAKEAHWEGYKKIIGYLDSGVNGFKNVYIINHQKNLGPEGNYIAVREIIYQKYDGYIYTEDDNVFSPNFLQYMNVCMEYFRDDEKVMAVSGYMYPVNMSDVNGNVLRINTYFSAFGFGIYRKWSERLDKAINLQTFLKMYRNVKMMRKLKKISPNQYCNFVKGMVEYIPDLIYDGDIRSVDLAWGLYDFFYGYDMIFPVISKVRNNGYDGSGVNCAIQNVENVKSDGSTYREYDFSRQQMDTGKNFFLDCPEKVDENIVNERLSGFFAIPSIELLKTNLVYIISLVLGRKNTASMIRIIHGYKR